MVEDFEPCPEFAVDMVIVPREHDEYRPGDSRVRSELTDCVEFGCGNRIQRCPTGHVYRRKTTEDGNKMARKMVDLDSRNPHRLNCFRCMSWPKSSITNIETACLAQRSRNRFSCTIFPVRKYRLLDCLIDPRLAGVDRCRRTTYRLCSGRRDAARYSDRKGKGDRGNRQASL